MAKREMRRIMLVVALLAVIAIGDQWITHGAIGHWLAGRTDPVFEPVVAAVSSARLWGSSFFSRTDLAAENVYLKSEIERLHADAAQIDALRNELEFTRAAAGIRDRLPVAPIAAGIFSWYQAGSVKRATINRGTEDGITTGNIVLTSDGALIGTVRDVYSDHATVVLVGDPTIQIAARILGKNVSGLIRASEDGLIMDFVRKEESVLEGDTVLTAGNDHFPAGIIIGTVRLVDTSQPTLFAVVRVDPVIAQPFTDAVLILP